MPTLVTIRRNFVVQSLLEIEDEEFAHWYGLGVYWAMWGDCQGHGPYNDTYIIQTIETGIHNGWYNDLNSSWFSHVGFYVGMLHGGFLAKPSETLVVLTDPDFTKGYYVGRDYCFTEAETEPTDAYFNEHIHNWALEYQEWHEGPEVLRYAIGCRIGELSGAVLPLTTEELTFEDAVNTAAAIRL